jgi:hypothetical protein
MVSLYVSEVGNFRREMKAGMPRIAITGKTISRFRLFPVKRTII